MTICLAIGTVFLFIGFVALFNIRRNFKRSSTTAGLYNSANSGPGDGGSSHQFDQRASIAKLEALMMKIGIKSCQSSRENGSSFLNNIVTFFSMFSIAYVIPAGMR